MTEPCRVSIDELNHDHNSCDVDEATYRKDIMERADEIMGNCAIQDHDDRDFMREVLLDNDKIINLILDMGWLFRPDKHVDSDVPVTDVLEMARMAQKIVNELETIAIKAAIEE